MIQSTGTVYDYAVVDESKLFELPHTAERSDGKRDRRKPQLSGDLIVWGSSNDGCLLLAARCAGCGGAGDNFRSSSQRTTCHACLGTGWLGIDPHVAARARPGSVEKLAVLSARYALGAPLWNSRDTATPAAIGRKHPIRAVQV